MNDRYPLARAGYRSPVVSEGSRVRGPDGVAWPDDARLRENRRVPRDASSEALA